MTSATPERPWLGWYVLKRWLIRREQQLFKHPTCEMCEAKGLVVAAQVADHIQAHRGDYKLFWFGKLQSLCMDCHNRDKQQLETKGYTTDIGADGWPVDPRHPSNRKT
jgi:5-methylcytosine-specific restriction protein A